MRLRAIGRSDEKLAILGSGCCYRAERAPLHSRSPADCSRAATDHQAKLRRLSDPLRLSAKAITDFRNESRMRRACNRAHGAPDSLHNRRAEIGSDERGIGLRRSCSGVRSMVPDGISPITEPKQRNAHRPGSHFLSHPCNSSQSANLSIQWSVGKLCLRIPKPWPPLAYTCSSADLWASVHF